MPLFILGSSLFGANLAAQLGLPFAFASHFAPEMLHQAAHEYRTGFDAAGPLAPPDAKPWLMAGVNIVAADEAEEAAEQKRLAENGWPRDVLAQSGPLDDDAVQAARQHPQGRQILTMIEHTIAGTQEQVVSGLDAFAAEVQADELIIVTLAVAEEQKRRTLEMLAPDVI